jgi:hypothetical protein
VELREEGARELVPAIALKGHLNAASVFINTVKIFTLIISWVYRLGP